MQKQILAQLQYLSRGSNIKNSKFSYLTTLHCISVAISQSIDRSKLTAESKQTTDYIKNSNFSYLTALHYSSEAISQSKAENKQTAESKRTADFIKNYNFHTSQLCIVAVRQYLKV